MLDKITLRGVVGTPPRTVTTSEGTVITSFRLASSQSYWDRTQKTWVETETNWYTVTAFRQLASNAAVSVAKGDRVVVTGALKVREWKSGERTGLTVEVEAESIGFDLAWGTGTFSRSARSGTDARAVGERGPDELGTGGAPVPALAETAGSSDEMGRSSAELDRSRDDGSPRAIEPVGAGWAGSADDPTPF
jgi:single-strand DNA-binding protein